MSRKLFLFFFFQGLTLLSPHFLFSASYWGKFKRAVNKLSGDMDRDLQGFFYRHNDGVVEYLEINKDKTFHYYNNVVKQGEPGAYNEYGIWNLNGNVLNLKSNLSNRVERFFKVAIEDNALRLERDKQDNPLIITYIGEMSPKVEKFVRYFRAENEADASKGIQEARAKEEEKSKRELERDSRRQKREEEKRKKEEERAERKKAAEEAKRAKKGKSNPPSKGGEQAKSQAGKKEETTPIPLKNPTPLGSPSSEKESSIPSDSISVQEGLKRLEAALESGKSDEVRAVTEPSPETENFSVSRSQPAFNERQKLPVSQGFLGHYVYQDGPKDRHQLRVVENDLFYYINPRGIISNGTFQKETSLLNLDDKSTRRRFRYIKEGDRLILYRTSGDRLTGGTGGIAEMAPHGNEPVIYRKIR